MKLPYANNDSEEFGPADNVEASLQTDTEIKY